jgi:hypothetical protein
MIGYTPMVASNAPDWTPDEATVDHRAELRARIGAVTARHAQPDPPDHVWDRGSRDDGRDAGCSCRQTPCEWHEPYSCARAHVHSTEP